MHGPTRNSPSYGYLSTSARLSSISASNGQNTLFSYFGNTGDQRLQEIKNLDPSASVISQFDYAYNVAGEITNSGRRITAG